MCSIQNSPSEDESADYSETPTPRDSARPRIDFARHFGNLLNELNTGNFDFQNSESAGVLLDPNYAGTSDEEEEENRNENANHNEEENANANHNEEENANANHNEEENEYANHNDEENANANRNAFANQQDHENDDFSDEDDASSDSFDDNNDPLDEYEEYDDFDQEAEDADALMNSYVSDMINYLNKNSKDNHSSFLLADCPNLTSVEIGGFCFGNYASCTFKSFVLVPFSL